MILYAEAIACKWNYYKKKEISDIATLVLLILEINSSVLFKAKNNTHLYRKFGYFFLYELDLSFVKETWSILCGLLYNAISCRG